MQSCRQQGSMYDNVNLKKINQTADFLIQLRYKAWFSLVMQAQAQAQTQA